MNWTDLAGTLIRNGAPTIGGALGGPVGGQIGGVLGGVIADVLGVPATPEAVNDALQDNPHDAQILEDTTHVRLKAIALEREAIAGRLSMADKDRAEGPLAYAWRWGWMYLLAVFWIWTLILVPTINAVAGGAIERPPLDILMTLTGAYLALYMGGHTVKAAVAKRG